MLNGYNHILKHFKGQRLAHQLLACELTLDLLKILMYQHNL